MESIQNSMVSILNKVLSLNHNNNSLGIVSFKYEYMS